uniref:Reticulon-like protein n=1 Tax=Kalanchoe fedtschenkoi TaxID=63787 RepID=A0A7N0TKJ9_KALFE
MDQRNPRTCVVLHGRTLLGRSLVLRLLRIGNWIVRIADSADSLQLDSADRHSLLPDALSDGRASYHFADISQESQLISVIEGSSVLFYISSTDIDVHDTLHCYQVIVQGAKNVINACRKGGVKRLVFDSNADIVFNGSQDIYNGDESLPIPSKFEDIQHDLKAQAEALVLCANDIDGLLTCALRPCNVFGPGDTQFLPILINHAKSGLAKFIVGNGENISDFTFVENVAHAHICAEEALVSQMISVAGKAFFITNLKPIKFWEFVSLLFEGLGYQRPLVKLPVQLVSYILAVVSWMCDKSSSGMHNRISSHYIVQLFSRTRTFNCTGAQKYIGYSPITDLKEGISLTVASSSHLAKVSSVARLANFNKRSKADKLLGSGKAAEILLWRDEKRTFSCFISLVLLFYWFLLSGRTFVSSLAKLLLLGTIILFVRGILPSNIFGLRIWKPSSCFQISETAMQDPVKRLVYFWNGGVQLMKLMAKGEDWNMFFKLVILLYIMKFAVAQSLTMLIGVALVAAFTVFYVYEQYEKEMDGLVEISFNIMVKLAGFLAGKLPPRVMTLIHNNGIFVQD